MSQPERVINHSGVAPEPVDPLEGINPPTAGGGPSLVERIRGMLRGAGGSFNPRMIALFVGGVILFLIALGLFVKQSPAKASTNNAGPMKTVEVKKDATYKSSPPVVAATHEGRDDHSNQQTSSQEEQINHTPLAAETGRDGSRQAESISNVHPVENGSGDVYSADASGSHSVVGTGSSGRGVRRANGSSIAAGVEARERHYAVDYEALREQIAKAETTESPSGLNIEAALKSSPPVNIAPVQSEQGTVLPRGLRIKMELLDPFQSGLSAMVRARVLEDVRLKDGKLIVPANSEVYLPMLELAVATPDNKGRVVVNPKPSEEEMGFITIGEDSRIMLKGTAYGADSLAGLPGKRTKIDGQPKFSALKRIAGRASGALSGMSPVPLYGIESEIDRGSYSYERTTYIVNVPAHTKFTFVVGL